MFMKEQKMVLSSSSIRDMAKKITGKAKKRNLIKPLSEAFKDVPAKKEIHKGNVNYFN